MRSARLPLILLGIACLFSPGPATPAAACPGGAAAQTAATAVLPSSMYVKNADAAVGRRDRLYAYIDYGGFLDLEFEARNGAGDDIAVYARGPAEGIVPEFLVYTLLGSDGGEEWLDIGQGDGSGNPDTFDLGELRTIRRLRIVYRLSTEIGQQLKINKLHPVDYVVGIDAVEALH